MGKQRRTRTEPENPCLFITPAKPFPFVFPLTFTYCPKNTKLFKKKERKEEGNIVAVSCCCCCCCCSFSFSCLRKTKEQKWEKKRRKKKPGTKCLAVISEPTGIKQSGVTLNSC